MSDIEKVVFLTWVADGTATAACVIAGFTVAATFCGVLFLCGFVGQIVYMVLKG